MADAQGQFKIDSVSSNLLFDVVVAARGFEPTNLTKVDPLRSPLTVRLKPRPQDQLTAKRTVFGRLVDTNKRPLAGARLEILGFKVGNGGGTWGRMPDGTDAAAVSDAAGEFEIYIAKDCDAVALRIDAPGVARTTLSSVPLGGSRHDFVLPAGAALVGRVVRNGKPVQGINIGVAGADRAAGSFTGDFVVGTDTNGFFVFPNLPASREYQFYGVMDSLRGMGALPARNVRVGGDGSRTDLGVINLEPGWRVAGEVSAANAKTLPVGSRLLLFREGAWDFSVIDLPADGRFDLPNVPGEQLNLEVGMSGYRAAGDKPKLGRLQSDRTGLVFVMEPGK
jgi:hypothetical protein